MRLVPGAVPELTALQLGMPSRGPSPRSAFSCFVGGRRSELPRQLGLLPLGQAIPERIDRANFGESLQTGNPALVAKTCAPRRRSARSPSPSSLTNQCVRHRRELSAMLRRTNRFRGWLAPQSGEARQYLGLVCVVDGQPRQYLGAGECPDGSGQAVVLVAVDVREARATGRDLVGLERAAGQLVARGGPQAEVPVHVLGREDDVAGVSAGRDDEACRFHVAAPCGGAVRRQPPPTLAGTRQGPGRRDRV